MLQSNSLTMYSRMASQTYSRRTGLTLVRDRCLAGTEGHHSACRKRTRRSFDIVRQVSRIRHGRPRHLAVTFADIIRL
jgi:hypothetical protein